MKKMTQTQRKRKRRVQLTGLTDSGDRKHLIFILGCLKQRWGLGKRIWLSRGFRGGARSRGSTRKNPEFGGGSGGGE